MIIGDSKSDEQLVKLIPTIESQINEWQIVNVNILRESQLTRDQVMDRIYNEYKHSEGIIYPISSLKVIMIVRLGIINNYAIMKNTMETNLPSHCCRFMLRKMNEASLKQIQADLNPLNDNANSEESMFIQRQKRRQNVLLIADDDSFIRKAMKKILLASGSLVEAEDSKKVILQYINNNPDILFLDIHMPGKNGLELIQDIMGIDPDAYIIVLSADSSAENVLKALEEGAVGFLSKPPSKKKMLQYITQCITIQ